MKRKETVSRVIDGDTFLTKSRTHAVRLAHVDAPERGTRSGTHATEYLQNLIQGKAVEVSTVARDCYGRAVANVKVNGVSVNSSVKRNLKN